MHKETLVEGMIQRGVVKSAAVRDAFLKVNREDFIPDNHKDEAYGDYPLHIMLGQTISQPTTIAMMLEALDLKKGLKVLEIGAGSGYSASLIAEIIRPGRVFSVEIIEELAEYARKNVAGIKNLQIVASDGSIGLQKEAPFDRIVVTAACPSIPPPLVKQLKETGILVAPVDSMFNQVMIKGRKVNGKLDTEKLGFFSFVPLKGKHGFD